MVPPSPVGVGSKFFFQVVAPDADRVTLYYRANVEGAAFQNRAMLRNGDAWTANVPVDSGMLPGVQYFVKAVVGGKPVDRGSPLRPLRAAVSQ